MAQRAVAAAWHRALVLRAACNTRYTPGRIAVRALLLIVLATMALGFASAALGQTEGRLPDVSLRSLGWIGERPREWTTNIGSVTSQGDFSPPGTPGGIKAAAARATFGVDGAGIKIGVISDSYNRLGGAGAGILSGDLPGIGNPLGKLLPVNVIKDDLAAGRTDEGRAMLEIVHDLAPGAQLVFHSAFNNSAGSPGQQIADAINNLKAAGCNVIIDDVFFLNEPYFQDGVAAHAVNAAKAAGVAYFSSAGNEGRNAYQSSFKGAAGQFHNFNATGTNNLLNISVPNQQSFRVAVEWNDPYPSVSGPFTPADYDVGIWDYALSNFVNISIADQGAGVDPWELVGVTNTSGATKIYGLAIQNFAGSTDRQLKAIVYDSGTINDVNDTDSPTVVGHAAAEGAVSVAAVRYDSSAIEAFSSRGGTTILFDASGFPIVMARNTPLLTATNGVDTTFFGGADYEANGFQNFFGTSASAPAAGAAAALLLERAAQLGISLSVDDLYSILFATARDIQSPGFDFDSGFGIIDLQSALAAVPEPHSALLCAFSALGLSIFVRLHRRRR